MKLTNWLPTLAVLSLLLTPRADALRVRAQVSEGAGAAAALSAAPYRVGEKLSYTVSFSRFPVAGHVELFVAARTSVAGRESVELRAHVETTGIVSAALYSLNNDYTSFVDPATGLPLRTRQVLREGNSTAADAERDYNQPLGASAFPAHQTAGGFPGTYDLLSAVYRLRSLPLGEGASYRFSVQGASALYEAELKVEGRELLKTNIGSLNTVVTRVRVRNDDDADDYRVRVYFSADERHIPVLVTARHPSGEIRAEIASAEFVEETPAVVPPSATSAPQPPNRPPDARQQGTQRSTPLVVPPSARTTPGGTTGGAATLPPGPLRSRGETADADEGDEEDGALPGLPFRVGEQLNFRFFLGNTAQPVGTASLQVRARARYFNRDGLLLGATMATTGAGQTLFPVSDQISSYVDPTSLLPFRTELRIQESRHRFNAVVTLDQDRGNASFADGTRLDIPVGTHDLVSVFYALRSFDLTPPRRNAVSLLINKRPRTLFVTSLGRENIQVGAQTIPATLLSLTTDDPQGDRLQIRLWVSADRRRLPLRIAALTPLGPVRADLAIIPVSSQ